MRAQPREGTAASDGPLAAPRAAQRSRLTRLITGAAVGATLAAITVTTPASAAEPVSWGPLDSSYKDQVRVSGYGTVQLDGGGTQVSTRYTLTEPADDGNTVYARTSYQFYKICSPAETSPSWCNDRVESTPEIANTTGSFTTSVPLDRAASQVRALVQVCAQMGWPVPDSCSDEAFITLSY